MSQTVIISCYQIKINLIIQKGKLNDPILTGFLGLMFDVIQTNKIRTGWKSYLLSKTEV